MRIIQLVDRLVQFIADFDPYEHKDQANGQALFKSLVSGEVAPIRERLFLFAEESEVFEEIDRACELIRALDIFEKKGGYCHGKLW